MSEAPMNFEASIQRLEEIVGQIEQGKVPLEEALRLFEEGTALVGQCNQLLDQAEQKVTLLMQGPDGKPIEMEFEQEDE